jgi:zinc transport system substrate-binding protein
MRNFLLLLLPVLLLSCNQKQETGKDTGKETGIITVSIAPYRYFVESIAGDDYSVNIMVPAGSDPHIYEPAPNQITALRKSAAYISNGYLGFEMAWLARLYEVNGKMKKLDLGKSINPIESDHHDHEGPHNHSEGADPHYWVSPKCAAQMAESVRDFLKELNPSGSERYHGNCNLLLEKINELDRKAEEYFSGYSGSSFMIYHPNLAYLARDYGLKEIAVESEGKEPSPSGMKELIDLARKENLKTIFVQREYDRRNALAIAAETGASIVIIDPLSADWYQSTSDILEALHKSLKSKDGATV